MHRLQQAATPAAVFSLNLLVAAFFLDASAPASSNASRSISSGCLVPTLHLRLPTPTLPDAPLPECRRCSSFLPSDHCRSSFIPHPWAVQFRSPPPPVLASLPCTRPLPATATPPHHCTPWATAVPQLLLPAHVSSIRHSLSPARAQIFWLGRIGEGWLAMVLVLLERPTLPPTVQMANDNGLNVHPNQVVRRPPAATSSSSSS